MLIRFQARYRVTVRLDGSRIDHDAYGTIPVELEIPEAPPGEMIRAFTVTSGDRVLDSGFRKGVSHLWRRGSQLYEQFGEQTSLDRLLPDQGRSLEEGSALGVPRKPVYIPGVGGYGRRDSSIPPLDQVGWSSRSYRNREITSVVSDRPDEALRSLQEAASRLLLVDGKLMRRCPEPVYKEFLRNELSVVGFTPEEIGVYYGGWNYYAADQIVQAATGKKDPDRKVARIDVHDPHSVRFDSGSVAMTEAPGKTVQELALIVHELPYDAVDHWCRLRDAVRDPDLRRTTLVVSVMRDLGAALAGIPEGTLTARDAEKVRTASGHVADALRLWDGSEACGRRWWPDPGLTAPHVPGAVEIVDAYGLSPLLQHMSGAAVAAIAADARGGALRAFACKDREGAQEILLDRGSEYIRYPVVADLPWIASEEEEPDDVPDVEAESNGTDLLSPLGGTP